MQLGILQEKSTLVEQVGLMRCQCVKFHLKGKEGITEKYSTFDSCL